MFLGKHVRLFGKVAHVFKKTRTCFSMEDKEGSKDKKNFYNNSLFCLLYTSPSPRDS